jgi:hypothetical protein
VTEGSGLDFRYRNGGEAGLRAILESLGGGVALLDYDGDGRLDVFVTGGGRFVRTDAGVGVQGWPNGLFHNEGNWKFRDVTTETGLDEPCGYTHGCAVGDYDNDGDPDLLVTSYEGAVLFRNEQGRRFVDVTAEVGLHAPGWSSSAAWADFDNDGWLDLYVARYVAWSPTNNPPCRYRDTGPEVVDICSPSAFSGLDDSIYHNRCSRGFVDVSRSVGLLPGGKGLGVLACDLDGDRDIDIYVANDTSGNTLYENRGDGTFTAVGDSSGATLSHEGIPTGSMGVDAADIDDDGDLDIWVTNYEGETNELYRNEGRMTFTPRGIALGLGSLSRSMVGWGTGFIDFDHDGRLDCFVANGHLLYRHAHSPAAQRPFLFRQRPDGRFEEVGKTAGSYFARDHLARGCAFGDLDGDGDLDVVVVHQNEPVALLRNDSPEHPALRLRLEGRTSNRSAIGATVIVTIGARKLTRAVIGGGSYLSQSDRRLVIGLGAGNRPDFVEVRWPSGQTDRHTGLSLDQPWLLHEGEPPVRDRPAGDRRPSPAARG